MLFYLFPVLWGALLALILSAPSSYYLLFISILIISIGIFIYSTKFFSKLKFKSYIIFALTFLIFYIICSFIIFSPPGYKLVGNKNISPHKKALIFYCAGEMEKYSPKYVNYLLKDVNYMLKPIYAYRIKTIYKNVDASKKNSDILRVAKEVKNSILNYKPYFFYIAFSSYFPNINASVQSAINDGCSDITIINYTNNVFNKNEINLNALKNFGISINITKPIYDTDDFSNAIISKVSNISLKYDGILLLDNYNSTSEKIKSGFFKLGYNDKNVYISTNINKAIQYFKDNNINNILYVNLNDSSNSYKSEVLLPKEFEKYANQMKITGINSWGYDKYLVKAVIDTIKNKQ